MTTAQEDEALARMSAAAPEMLDADALAKAARNGFNQLDWSINEDRNVMPTELIKALRDTARDFAAADPAPDCPAESYIEWKAADHIAAQDRRIEEMRRALERARAQLAEADRHWLSSVKPGLWQSVTSVVLDEIDAALKEPTDAE